jgi:hypothetical protein
LQCAGPGRLTNRSPTHLLNFTQSSAKAAEAGIQIASALRSLIQAIPRYQLELRTYWYSAAVSDAISAALAQVICYIRNAELFLSKSSLKRKVRAAFSDKFSQILSQFEKADQALGVVIRAAQGKGEVVWNASLSFLELITSRSKVPSSPTHSDESTDMFEALRTGRLLQTGGVRDCKTRNTFE